jgi:hypothetical protein
MSIASVVRRGYAESVPSVVLRGYSPTTGAPLLIGNVGPIKLVKDRPARDFEIALIFSGAGITYAIAPALEVEASFNTSTGVLTWNPLNEGSFGPYTVTASNANGSTDSDAFTVTVQLTASSAALFPAEFTFKTLVGL